MLNWTKYNKDTFKDDILNNNLEGKELIFKMQSERKEGEFEHQIGTCNLNSQGQMISIVGNHFLFDYNHKNIISFSDLSNVL